MHGGDDWFFTSLLLSVFQQSISILSKFNLFIVSAGIKFCVPDKIIYGQN